MLRITELTLPNDHDADALIPAIAARLKVAPAAVRKFTVFKRGYDARRKNVGLSFVYTIDVEVENEAAVLARLRGDRNVEIAPDMTYRFVAGPPQRPFTRPIVVGFGPCGIF